MQVLSSLFGRQAASFMRTTLLSGVRAASTTPASPRDWYDVLRAYYESNALYNILRDARVVAGLNDEAMRSIRNPAFRAVEFHASHLWPGALPDALPIETENAQLEPAIQQVWNWSNWGAKKQVVARNFPLYGDWFAKIRSTGDALPLSERRVWFQHLAPQAVTDYSKDDRGFLTYIRIDVPKITTDSAGAVTERWSHVEVWDKASGTYRQWHHTGDSVDTAVEQLTGLVAQFSIMEYAGVDFIPIVHAPFRDVGDARGVGCFVPVIDKIDELNRIASRLHQMGFRNMRNLFASLRTGTDSANRPLPAAQVGKAFASATQYNKDGQVTNGAARVDDAETFIDLPGSTSIESLVPDLKYEALLEIARDQLEEIADDLPEIRWYALSKQGADLSSRAIRLLLAPAIARAEEARGNAETALVRADQMALSMGQAIGLFGGIGTFDGGDFEHSFAERDIMPLNDLDKAEADRSRAQAAQAYRAAEIPLMTILTDVMDKTEQDARKILRIASQEADEAAERARQAFDAGDNGEGDQEDER